MRLTFEKTSEKFDETFSSQSVATYILIIIVVKFYSSFRRCPHVYRTSDFSSDIVLIDVFVLRDVNRSNYLIIKKIIANYLLIKLLVI